MKYATYETEQGIGAAIFSEKGLYGVVFPQPDEKLLEEELADRFGICEYDADVNKELSSTLAKYFNGEQVTFENIQLDYGSATAFEKSVYNYLKAIPYGETTSYKELAAACGRPRAARAVGNAMAKNKLLVVIPCHRVLKSDGSFGGWSGRPGWKEKLHEIERGTFLGFHGFSRESVKSEERPR